MASTIGGAERAHSALKDGGNPPFAEGRARHPAAYSADHLIAGALRMFAVSEQTSVTPSRRLIFSPRERTRAQFAAAETRLRIRAAGRELRR
jgi:hypothetical protein